MFFKKKNGVKWLIVFLGNPGLKYQSTRHNVGFMASEIIERRVNVKINRARFNALTATSEIRNEKALLIKPQTYMNLSGNAVNSASSFYKIPPEHILVICDDISLPVGKLRIRKTGSAGGHNGLKSIISALGTEDFPRIKIGVGAPISTDENAVIKWVLGSFSQKDKVVAEEACARAVDAIEVYICEGSDKAMNMYN